MNDIKLQVGKCFLNREGEVVEIVGRRPFNTHPYLGSDDEYYRANGRVGFFREHTIDLVEETTQTKPRRPSASDLLFATMFKIDLKRAA